MIASQPLPQAALDSTELRLTQLEAEAVSLRADSAALRSELALRDHALDATPTFFLIARLTELEPIIVYCNKALADQHGFVREDLIGQSIGVLARWVNPGSSRLSKAGPELLAGRTLRYEEEVTRRDGSTFWLGVSVQPLNDASGRLTHTVAVGADITPKREEARKKQQLQDKLVDEMRERERIAVELQLAQKLESVGRLAAGIAHEINTPIQYVGDSLYFLRTAHDAFTRLIDGWESSTNALPESAANDLLREQIAASMRECDMEFLRAEIPKAFERTFDGIQRVTNIVNAMKEFAHPDTNEQGAADINHAIRTTLLVASNEYKYLAKVFTELAELPEVTCNIGELNQVFLNLIVNAAHAIQDAGRDLNTGEIRVSTLLAGESVEIRIADNGCGVPADNLSKIFDPFFTTKEVGRGTGQGLAIARSIVVDKHAGHISVNSGTGVGTEFLIRLPMAGRDAGSSA